MTDNWLGIDQLHQQQHRTTQAQAQALAHECQLYAQCFGTPAGQQVLQQLERIMHSQTWDPTKSPSYGYYREGQNDVLRHIINRVNHAKRSQS